MNWIRKGILLENLVNKYAKIKYIKQLYESERRER